MSNNRTFRSFATAAVFVLVSLLASPAALAQADDFTPEEIEADASPISIMEAGRVEQPGAPLTVGDIDLTLEGTTTTTVVPALPEQEVLSEDDVELVTATRNELQFASLTSRLIEQFDGFETTDVATFAQQNSASLDSLIGQDLRSALPSAQVEATSISDFLADEGFVFAAADIGSYSDLRAQMVTASSTPDGLVAAAAADWATRLSGLDVPDVATQLPDLPASAATLSTAPDEALMFGLFADKALSALATDSPAVLDSILTGELSNGQIQARFEGIRGDVGQWLQTDQSSSLISPCHNGLLTAMATGSSIAGVAASSDECAPCAAAGSFLSNNVGQLWGEDPTFAAEIPAAPAAASDYEGLASWWDTAEEPTPFTPSPSEILQLETLTDSTNGLEADCQAASVAQSSHVSNTLPQILEGLSR